MLSIEPGPPTVSLGSNSYVAPADLNGDGLVDLVVTFSYPRKVQARLQQPDGSYRVSSLIELPGEGLVGTPVIFDYDNDNSIDVLIAGSVVRVNEQGDLTLDTNTAVPLLNRDRLLDIDQDGFLDLISRTNSTAFAVYFGSPTGLVDRFDFGAGSGPKQSQVVGITDIDGDGKLDIEFYNGHLNSVMTLCQFSGRVFYEVSQRTLEQGEDTYDMNGDGRTDYIKIANNQIRIEYGTSESQPLVTIGSYANQPSDPIPVYSPQFRFNDIDRDGLADIISQSEVPYMGSYPYFISRQLEGGQFSSPIQFTSGGVFWTHTSTTHTYLSGFSDLNGDRILDFRMSTNHSSIPMQYNYTDYRWYSLNVDVVSTVRLFEAELIPFHDNVAHVRASSSSPNDPLTSIDLYFDSNNNGRWDSTDQLLTTQPVSGTDVTTDIAYRVDRDVQSTTALFAIARTASGSSDPALRIADPWKRLFMPEGYRNINTVDEHIPLVNPNDFDVPYQIIAHYETGERDQVVFSGVLAAHSRGGHTLSLRGNSTISNVRPNTPYAIEVISRGTIGAMLVRSDTFGNRNTQSVVMGESFTSQTNSGRIVPGLSAQSLDFLLMFNPGISTLDLTIDFIDAGQIIATTHRTIEPFRRSGVAVFEVPQLAGRTNFTASINANGQLVTSFSRHEPQQSRGQLSLGSTFTNNLGTIDLTRNQSAQLLLTNVDLVPTITTLQFVTDTTQFDVPINLPGLSSQTLDIRALVPTGTRFVSIRSSNIGNIATRVIGTDSLSNDAWSFAPQSAATRWLFADNYLDPARLGTSSLESLQLSNTTNTAATVTIKFLQPSGDTITIQRTLEPRAATTLNLHELPELTTHPNLNWFSTVIESTQLITASLQHTDLTFGGTWASAGVRW